LDVPGSGEQVIPLIEEARQILEREFHLSGWDIEKPTAVNKDAVIATHGDRRVFLKLDVDGTALSRLAALCITPALLASGIAHDRAYAIQEYIEGSHPDRTWFAQHLPDLAQFIRRYHTDAALTRLLAPPDPPSYADHVRQQIARLERGMQHARTPPLRTPQAGDAFHQLAKQAQRLQRAPLVPTHADPNNTNFRLVRDHFYLLDWDDVGLSDPLRDVGLLLWWYVLRERWPEFFTVYGMAMDDALLRKVYWWSAYASLGVAQWFDAHTQDEEKIEAFLLDFHAALNRRENPHAAQASPDFGLSSQCHRRPA
jgi:aminoglycoside phosphotransferase (APT) family kinase protein